MSTACPAWLAGEFGAAVAEADRLGERIIIEPVPGARVVVLPQFAALPVPRVIQLLQSCLAGAARIAGVDVSHLTSGAACPQAAALSPGGAAGGEPAPNAAGVDAGGVVQPARATASQPKRMTGCTILPFPGRRG